MKTKQKMRFVLALLLGAGTLFAQESTPGAQQDNPDEAAELAKQLANPVAALINVPFQYNYDRNYGSKDKGSKSLLNIQPVIPFVLNDDWNLIVRTIIPLIDQSDVLPGTDQSGFGDITQSFFFSPKKPVGGWVVAAGPVFLYPTATDNLLGGKKWGAGPTALALTQTGSWTYGGMANHIWSIAGDSDRSDINATFLQPFGSYILPTHTTLTLTSETTYDWKNEQWAVPVNLTVSQMLKVGSQALQLGVGTRYWLKSPDTGPEGWGFRMQLSLLFPK